MIKLTITDWSDTQLEELNQLFLASKTKGYDVKLSFEYVESDPS